MAFIEIKLEVTKFSKISLDTLDDFYNFVLLLLTSIDEITQPRRNDSPLDEAGYFADAGWKKSAKAIFNVNEMENQWVHKKVKTPEPRQKVLAVNESKSWKCSKT